MGVRYEYTVGAGNNLVSVAYWIDPGEWVFRVVHNNGSILAEESGSSALPVVGVWLASSIPGNIKMEPDPLDPTKFVPQNGGLVIQWRPLGS